MYKVWERGGKSGKGEGELGVEEREKDSQPIEPCLDVLTHTQAHKYIYICMYVQCVCMQNEAGEINEIAETNAAKRRRLEHAAGSGMHSGAKCKRIP